MNKKNKPNLVKYRKEFNKHLESMYQMVLDSNNVWVDLVDLKTTSETEKQKLARFKKEKARRKVEEKRRAKKITMTVGEFEDKLDEVRDNYDY